MDLSKTHIQLVERVYKTLESNIAKFKARKGNSLTLAEKVLYGHAKEVSDISLNRGEDFGDFLPDRVAMQDACLLYTSPSPRDRTRSRMPSSA